MEGSTSQTGESSRPSGSSRDGRREVDNDRRRDDGDKYGGSSRRRDYDDGERSARRGHDRDDYSRRRDDDRDRDSRRSDRRDGDKDRRRERRASPSGRDADRARDKEEQPSREQRDSRRRDYDDRDRRRERDGGSDRRYSRRDEGEDRDYRRRRFSRSPPASDRRRDGADRGSSRRDERQDGPSADTSHGLPPLQTDEPTSAQEVKQFVPPTKDSIMAERARVAEAAPAKRPMRLIEVIANDRLGGKVRVKCSPKDTVGDLKKLIAVQKGTKPEKIVLKKWYTIYKDHIALEDYEIHDGMSLEMS